MLPVLPLAKHRVSVSAFSIPDDPRVIPDDPRVIPDDPRYFYRKNFYIATWF